MRKRGSDRLGSAGRAGSGACSGVAVRGPDDAAPRRRRRRPAGCPADLRAHLVEVDPDHVGELAGERLDLGLVADARHQPGGVAQRVDAAVGAVEVVAGQDVVEGEAVERLALRDELADRLVALLEPQVARVHALGRDGDVGLRGEDLVAVEHLHGCLLPGRVAVEGEDHLAAGRLVVAEEAAQHPRVVGAERRAARGDRGRDAGEVAGHHVGVALDDDGLLAVLHRGAGQVDAVEHLALLVDRGLGGVEVLRLDAVVVEDPAGAEADRVAVGLADRPHQAAAEAVVVGAPQRDETGGDRLLVGEPATAQVAHQRLAVARARSRPRTSRPRPGRTRARARNWRATTASGPASCSA